MTSIVLLLNQVLRLNLSVGDFFVFDLGPWVQKLLFKIQVIEFSRSVRILCEKAL